jgi:oxaloacetate decarboxylase gamma subunit
MTILEMLEQSGVLTLLGMSIVFGFLIVLIIAVTIVGKFIQVIGADKDLRGPKAGTAAPGGSGNAAVTAAISAAVTEYRKTNS